MTRNVSTCHVNQTIDNVSKLRLRSSVWPESRVLFNRFI
jgi:hypothetical protein